MEFRTRVRTENDHVIVGRTLLKRVLFAKIKNFISGHPSPTIARDWKIFFRIRFDTEYHCAMVMAIVIIYIIYMYVQRPKRLILLYTKHVSANALSLRPKLGRVRTIFFSFIIIFIFPHNNAYTLHNKGHTNTATTTKYCFPRAPHTCPRGLNYYYYYYYVLRGSQLFSPFFFSFRSLRPV